ncbi:ABC transporter permease [Oribacterium sinus]|jgi:ABC superfamily ATP binding cassette transporter, permease protein|uniref:ABC transporter, permease protein n=1 Tax=Oribacterium sinus F0268 TaxID=585501 RepID=C2KVP4_9FIRM|nr:iron ABC transporter permease [Oribacterium sinus]EEJ52148.1 ABC transporter, permease protein [Oribacterium sinus F0268]
MKPFFSLKRIEENAGKRVEHSTLFSAVLFSLFIILLILPIVLFIVYPIFLLFWKAFQVENPGQYFQEIALRYKTAFFHSIESSFYSAVISTVMAFFLSYGIRSTGKWQKRIALILLSMSMVSPPFISSLSFITLYGRRGLITYRLLGLSFDPYHKWGVILMQSIHFACMNTLFFTNALEDFDGKLYDSGRDLGANAFFVLKDILLPLLSPAILASFFLSFLRGLSDFGTPIIIGGRYSTLATEIYLQIIGFSDFSKAAAMNILLLLPAFFSFLLYRMSMKRADERNKEQKGKTGLRLDSKHWMNLPIQFLLFFFLLFQLLQYASIFLYGFLRFNKKQIFFTWENMGSLFQYNLSTMGLSLLLAFAASVVGSFFAFLLAYLMERKMKRGKKLLDFALSLPYLLPGTCFGLAYILAFNKAPLKLTGTVWIMLFSLLFRQMPLGSRLASTALSQSPKNLELAARDLGAKPSLVFFQIILPGILPSFFSSVYLQFSQGLTTAGAIIFLISAKYKVLVYTLFDAINRGDYAVASLISGIMILLSLAFSFLLGRVQSLVCRRGVGK